jgi:hypothetical protein
MPIVLQKSHLTKGRNMTVPGQMKDTRTHEQAKQQSQSPSRLAAVVEAAYILEAVRK